MSAFSAASVLLIPIGLMLSDAGRAITSVTGAPVGAAVGAATVGAVVGAATVGAVVGGTLVGCGAWVDSAVAWAAVAGGDVAGTTVGVVPPHAATSKTTVVSKLKSLIDLRPRADI